MACRPAGAKPSFEPMLAYYYSTPWEQTSLKYESKFIFFHSRMHLKISSVNVRPFCLGLNVLNQVQIFNTSNFERASCENPAMADFGACPILDVDYDRWRYIDRYTSIIRTKCVMVGVISNPEPLHLFNTWISHDRNWNIHFGKNYIITLYCLCLQQETLCHTVNIIKLFLQEPINYKIISARAK